MNHLFYDYTLQVSSVHGCPRSCKYHLNWTPSKYYFSTLIRMLVPVPKTVQSEKRKRLIQNLFFMIWHVRLSDKIPVFSIFWLKNSTTILPIWTKKPSDIFLDSRVEHQTNSIICCVGWKKWNRLDLMIFIKIIKWQNWNYYQTIATIVILFQFVGSSCDEEIISHQLTIGLSHWHHQKKF